MTSHHHHQAAPEAQDEAERDVGRSRRRPRRLVWRARDSENSRLYNLQLDVQLVQQQLRALAEYRHALLTRALRRPRDDASVAFVRMVHEYFRVFRHGMSDADPQEEQLVFIRQFMHAQIVCGRFTGLHLLLRQWLCYSQALGPLSLSLVDAAVYPSSSSGSASSAWTTNELLVVARVRYTAQVTRAALETLFPHVASHERALAARLEGRRLHGVARFAFVFDVATRCVVRQELELDVATAFAALLQDAAQLATLLHGARISEEGYIGDLEGYE
ncbi:hypothetical protein PINS_up010093 [Pythium insidiosum]|nr:hypothetical protein PINS_up010093 [Pythium insidiosum]